LRDVDQVLMTFNHMKTSKCYRASRGFSATDERLVTLVHMLFRAYVYTVSVMAIATEI